MPLWLTIICSTGIASLVIKELWCAIKSNTKKAKDRVKSEKQEQMREVIKEEIDLISKKIDALEEKTNLSLASDVLESRCNMKAILERCRKQGYADIGDKSTFKQLMETYENLGGNSFKEYVNYWAEEMENLPIKENNK